MNKFKEQNEDNPEIYEFLKHYHLEDKLTFTREQMFLMLQLYGVKCNYDGFQEATDIVSGI